MELFFTLLFKLLPLLGIIILGYVAGRLVKVNKEPVALLLLYVLSPIIVFHGVYTTEIGIGMLVMPVFFFVVACLLCGVGYGIGKFLWKDNTRNIFAYSAGTGNTGYFGIPVAIALFGEGILGHIVMATMGLIFYESSAGFYITARGNYTMRDSITKVIMLPSVYALILGLSLNILKIDLPASYDTLAANFRGAYTVLGTMMIGLGMTGQALKVDWKFIGSCSVMKFIVWPVLTLGFVMLDQSTIAVLTPDMRRVLLLLSTMPMAANTVVIASALNVQPGKAALGVLLTTLFALLYIPLVLTLIPL